MVSFVKLAKVLFIPSLLLLHGVAWAQDRGKGNLVRIQIETHQDVYTLHNMGVSIENATADYVLTHLSPERIEELKAKGYVVTRMAESKHDTTGYHTYTQLTAKLDTIASDYPNITQLVSIGQSVQGRQLWAMQVTDNPGVEENEAEVRIASTIHGDEPVGTEMILYMLEYLTQNYGGNDSVTCLVDNREIWFVPMLNPDGNTAQSRYNAHSCDLNRNYPVPDGSIGEDGTYDWEPETEAFINWSNTRNFVLSTMYHTGALVTNYPYDYSPDPTPDHNMIYEISLGYARRNPPMYNSSVFDSGVVWGYYWYPVYGSLQDWSYYETGCIDLTIELYTTKWPSASVLPGLWDDNREAMLYLMHKAGSGLQGLVTDSNTGQPLEAEVVVIEIGKPIYTDPDIGDYHRMLLPGTYTFQFSAEGYLPQTFYNVEVVADSAARLDVQLHQPLVGNISGTVTDSVNGDPLYASVEVLDSGVDPVYTDSLTGYYSINVYQGTYTMRVSSNGYRTVTRDSVVVTETITEDFQLASLPVHYYTQTTPLPIPDNNGWVQSYLEVPDSIEVEDMNVFVNITHTYIGDLIAKLVSPLGTEVTLHDKTGGSDDSIVGWYDTDILPDGPGEMGDFIGENTQGQWALWLRDCAGGDIGTLNLWKLEIYGTGSVQEDSIAPAAITDLSVGSIDDTSATLLWTAPGDDGTSGTASGYDLRYSLTSVGTDTVGWWNSAQAVSGEPSPSKAGMLDSCIIQNLLPDTTYYFVIRAADEVPNWSAFSNVAIDRTTNVGVGGLTDFVGLPDHFELFQNYPNPFNPGTEVKYTLPKDSWVRLVVYNIFGQKVASLVDEEQKAGYKVARWDAGSFSSGIYFYRLQTGDFTQTRKMILLK